VSAGFPIAAARVKIARSSALAWRSRVKLVPRKAITVSGEPAKPLMLVSPARLRFYAVFSRPLSRSNREISVLRAMSLSLARVEAGVHPEFGFKLTVREIDPTFTVGDLKRKTEEIRRTLTEQGIWDRNRALPPADEFVRVAVISPREAAGLADFRATADRLAQHGLVRFDYHDVRFQHREAPREIVSVLRALYPLCKEAEYDAVLSSAAAGHRRICPIWSTMTLHVPSA
jgi:hypothetical protein